MTDAPAATAAPARAPRALGLLLRLDRRVQQVEVALCAACLLLMIGLAFAQVLLRTFRTETLQPVAWFDSVARHLVIWVGMLGASLATAEGRHIAVEALPKLLGPGGRRKNDLVVSLASLVVVGVLFVLSMIYMLRVQVPDPAHLFRIDALELDVPRWPFLAVVPVGLAVIGWRFALRAAQSWWMTDAEFQAREEALEREVTDAARGPDEAALLDEPAPQQGAPDDARPQAPAGEAAREAPAPADEGAPPAAAPAAPERPPVGRSTDELPVYRDLADDDDLSEPAPRHGGAVAESSDVLDVRPVLDSSDVLEPPDLGADDLVEDAVERLADTERLKIARDPGTSVADDEPIETDRLPRPDLPEADDDERRDA